ncbi:MAG: ABC transporter permease [Acidimicrobiia bacterium]|nr:MAG: ABC transporter permease [Acidimicrobiia bacterium]
MAEALELRRSRETKRRRITLMVALSLVFLVVLVVFAAFGTAITPNDHEEQRLFISDTPPSAEFWAGTDQLGRDIFSRTIIGARPALVGAVAVSVGAFTIATVLGLVSGYLGGAVDAGVMRWADLMLALPGLLIAIVVVGVFGGGFWVAVLVLILLFAAPDTRIVRSAVLEQRPLPYIEAARTLGVSKPRVMFGHVLPNILPIIFAYVVLDFAFALVALAGLSFLGLGIEPGAADWGRMLAENKGILFTNPWAAVLPALLIILTAASMNLVGDWMYDRFSLRQ